MGKRGKNYVLSGIIELDDTYFGAPKSNGKRGRGTDKTSALSAVSLLDEGHHRFLKMQISLLDAESVRAVAQRVIRPRSEIHSDALESFCATLQETYDHHYQIFDRDSGALRWIHILISNAKSFLLGTCHDIGKSTCKVTSMNLLSASIAASGHSSFSPPRLTAVASNTLGYGDLTR